MDQPPANAASPGTPRDDLAFIWKNIEQISNCMLVTRDSLHLRARPMRGIAKRDDNAIWFITEKSSQKDDEIAREPQGCLCYTDNSSNIFISLSGAVEMTDDPAQIHALWTAGAQAYFSAGPDDPDILLLKFSPDIGEYWDSISNPVLLAIQFVKSKVTGEKPKLGENKKIAMG